MKYSVKNIPANLKKYRLEHHKKQVEMAAFLEMNYQNYSKMERGYYKPSLQKFVEVCEKLHITPDNLLGSVDEKWIGCDVAIAERGVCIAKDKTV